MRKKKIKTHGAIIQSVNTHIECLTPKIIMDNLKLGTIKDAGRD